jgi:hypothetical protein
MWWMVPALAQEPWTLQRGETSVWLTGELVRWSELRGMDSEEIELGARIWRLGSALTVTRGLLTAWELEGSAGFASSWVSDPAAPGCAALGPGACEPTRALTPIELKLQNKLADGLAWGTTLRMGQASARDRDKLTGIGEGTTDLAAYFTGGRQGALGAASYRASSSLLGRLRPGLGSEALSWEVDGGARAELGLGALTCAGQLDLLHRAGLPLSELDPDSADRFADLGVTALDAGGQLLVRAGHVSLGLTVMSSVLVRDNPSDRLYIGAGVGGWTAGR